MYKINISMSVFGRPCVKTGRRVFETSPWFKLVPLINVKEIYSDDACDTASSTGFSWGFLGDNERGRIGEHGNELKARAEADGKEKKYVSPLSMFSRAPACFNY